MIREPPNAGRLRKQRLHTPERENGQEHDEFAHASSARSTVPLSSTIASEAAASVRSRSLGVEEEGIKRQF
jgi:hypothetical protein